MSQLNVDTIKKADGTGNLSVPAETGTVVTTASPSLGRRNLIINGAMQVAQRGTSVSSVSSSGYRAVDRYRHTVSIATWTISQSTDAPDGFGYSMKMDCTTAEASPGSTDALAFVQKIEGQDLQQLKKGTASAESATLSFWVKCTKTGTAQVNLVDEDNTRMIGQQFTINATNTWEQKTLTFAGDTAGALGNDNNSSLRVEIWLDAGSSYKSGATPTSWEALSSTDYFAGCDLNLGDSTSNDIYITGVQLEVGSVATPFEHRSYQDELFACMRYFERTEIVNGARSANSQVDGQVSYRVPKRTTTYSVSADTSGGDEIAAFGVASYNLVSLSSMLTKQIHSGTPRFTISSDPPSGEPIGNYDGDRYFLVDDEL